MIVCYLYEHALPDLVRGQLPSRLTDRLTAHVARCPRCRARAQEYRQALALFAQSTPPAFQGTYATLPLPAPTARMAPLPLALGALGAAVLALALLPQKRPVPAAPPPPHPAPVISLATKLPASIVRRVSPHRPLAPRSLPTVTVPPKTRPTGDRFITVTSPPLAALDKGLDPGLDAIQREQAISDPRLAQPVTLALKGQPFSRLCAQLSQETGIVFTAHRRVADDNLTLFCTKRPLRDLMQALALHFNMEWRRSGSEPGYTYELTQSLAQQLHEQSLRQRDHDAMLLQLEQEVRDYQKLLALPSDQRAARRAELESKSDPASVEEWARLGWIGQGVELPLQQFLELTPEQLDHLRRGETYTWDLPTLPKLSEQSQQALGAFTQLQGLLEIEKRANQYTLTGGFTTGKGGVGFPLARVRNPSRERVNNALLNKALAQDPGLKKSLALTLPGPYALSPSPYPVFDFDGTEQGPRLTTGDALEALHRATGRDLIADSFLRLSTPLTLSPRSLFALLCTLGDHLQLRWGQTEGWLTFRTTDYYMARLQEVPLRTREHWRPSQRGQRPLSELAALAALSQEALDSPDIVQALRALHGLDELAWVRAPQGKPHFRLLAGLTPEQREQAARPEGLAYSTLRPQQRVLFDQAVNTTTVSPRQLHFWVVSGADAERLLPGSGVVFVYRTDSALRQLIGPFSATALTEEEYQKKRL